MSSILRTQARARGEWRRRRVGKTWAFIAQQSTRPHNHSLRVSLEQHRAARREALKRSLAEMMRLPPWMSRLFSSFRRGRDKT